MAQQLLNHPEVGATVKQMRGKGVAQTVRPHPNRYSCRPQVLFHNPGDASGCDPSASAVQKDRCFTLRFAAQFFFLFYAVVPKGLKRQLADRDDSLFRTLSNDSNNAQLKVDITPVEPNQLTYTDSCRIENFQHCSVSAFQDADPLETAQKLEDIVNREKGWKGLFLLWGRNGRYRITVNVLFFY